MQRTIFVSLDDGVGNLNDLGFVKVIDECSYAEVRRETEHDELVEDGKSFVFLGERNLPLTCRQEDKFKVTSNEVAVRLADVQAPKRQKTSIDLENQSVIADPSETFRVHENQPQPQNGHVMSNSKLQSQLASKAEVYKWQKAIKHAVVKMREKNRKDRFELMSRDVGGKPEFSIWCLECNKSYGKGYNDAIYNFLNSHCKSKTHLQNCHENHLQECPPCEEVNEEDRCKGNKSLVDHCLSTEVAAFIEERGVMFKLYEPSVAGYAKLDAICIVCMTCEKTLSLFPRTGCLGQNLSDHITSNRHVHALMQAERRTQTNHELPNKGGRPKKSDVEDPRRICFRLLPEPHPRPL